MQNTEYLNCNDSVEGNCMDELTLVITMMFASVLFTVQLGCRCGFCVRLGPTVVKPNYYYWLAEWRYQHCHALAVKFAHVNYDIHGIMWDKIFHHQILIMIRFVSLFLSYIKNCKPSSEFLNTCAHASSYAVFENVPKYVLW